MPPIAVVTDSDASLPPELAARYGIRQVPITIHFGAEVMEAGVDIDDAATFARVDREKKLPKTAAPSPARFVQVFAEAFAEGASEILCFCVSSEVSATYSAALLAREQFPERDIRVVDTRTISMAIGFQAMAAAGAAAAGATVEEALAAAHETAMRTVIFASVADLKYLIMGGRVGHLTGSLAGLLDVKPLLTVRDGKLDLLERVRTRKRACERLLDLTRNGLGGRPAERLAVIHVTVPEDAQRLAEAARAAFPCPPHVVIAELTPGLSIHGGPGMIGLVAVAGRNR